jgi:hypoxanthine phosphoribosyltransferase
MDDIYIKLGCIIFISIAHASIVNKSEKVIMKILFGSNSIINRPLLKCKDSIDFSISCIGMPSGHTQIATIVSLLLSYYDLLPLPIAILTIITTGLQRVVTNMHSIEQVFIGLLFGLAYTQVYITTGTSFKSIILLCGYMIFLLLLILLYIDNIIQNDKIPDWVDKKMYNIIEKKKHAPFYLKCISVIIPFIIDDIPLYIDYKTLEIYLEKCITKIKDSNIKYDAIVGIKSGGAIISNYIAKKLNITNYTVKTTKKTNDCNSSNITFIETVIDYAINKRKDNKLCEGIDDNLENKNIILIDELVLTGATLEFIINYLLIEKKVANIFLLSIASSEESLTINNIKLNYIKNYKYSLIYPWGYDN